MPCFDIVRSVNIDDTFRVNSVKGTFDLNLDHTKEHFKGNIDIENKNWSIGLIVGGSGTGKSTIAREVFGEFETFTYSAKSVVDDMPKDKTIKEIQHAFASVGFGSPPSWLKPYSVLSNGEKMRVDLARCILNDKDLFVFDEFTSVVNREVAKTASYAISKAIRRLNKKFIAVSCHSDIIEWLCPDWIYDTDKQSFFTQRESSIAHKSNYEYKGLTMNSNMKFGKDLGSIII